MFRKIVNVLSAAGLVLMFCIPARAGDIGGSIRVIPEWADHRSAGGQVVLYRIGSLAEGGLRITDGLADWIIREEEFLTDDFLQWALQQYWDGGTQCVLTEEREAVFRGLDEGVYLVVQKGASEEHTAFAPFFATLSADSCMDAVFYPVVADGREIPRTGDYPAPIILAMVLSLTVVILMVLADNRRK